MRIMQVIAIVLVAKVLRLGVVDNLADFEFDISIIQSIFVI